MPISNISYKAEQNAAGVGGILSFGQAVNSLHSYREAKIGIKSENCPKFGIIRKIT